MEKSDQHRGSSTTSTNGVATNTSSTISPAENQGDGSRPEIEQKKTPRTPGLKIFDVLLYPIITNFAVFGLSVAATYLTNKGGMRTAEGKLVYGKVGEFFHKRGEWLKDKFNGMGMTESQADMSKMVAFSFIDGSLMAPVVKAFENRREHIGRAIDKKLGTCPDDDSAYDAEPKQSWLSVLGGRLATVAIVVPTAIALDKTGLNDRLFTQPGKRFGQYLATKPNIAKRFGALNIPELGKIGAFEAFYTSVCTTGIYFTSRMIAGWSKKKENKQEHQITAPENTPATPVSDNTAPVENADVNEPIRSFASRVRCKCTPKERAASQPFASRVDAEPELARSLA